MLGKYLKIYRKQVILGPIFKIIEAIFELIVPLIVAKIIDIGINGGGGKPYIIKMGGIMILLGLIGLCSTLVCQYMASVAAQGVGTAIRRDLFAHINGLSHKNLDEIGQSRLMTVLTNDVNAVQQAVAMMIRLLIRAPFLVIGATVMAMILDLKISIIFIIAAICVAAVLFLITKYTVPLYKNVQSGLDRVSLKTREGLSGTRVIRAFSKETDVEDEFSSVSDDVSALSIRVGRLSAVLNPLNFVLLNLALAALLYFGGIRVNAGNLTQGEIIAFVNYLNQILLALVVVANLIVLFTKAAASASRISEILSTLPAVVEGDYNGSQSSGDIAVSFDNVSLSYSNNNEYALENISFEIKKGQSIGIIGPTGSGKSSIVNLIPRFYDVTDGEVKFDGVNVKRYRFEALRNKIGIAMQNVTLLSASVRDNIAMGRNLSDDEIISALKIAQAWDFVQKTDEKLDYMLEDGGKNLSGGQRQRLTIARAVCGNPELLILDDSSSALDYATDAALRSAVSSELKGTTVITVSQRATGIKHCDKIIVLDAGKTVGIGTHDELFENCELYREICLSQLSSEEAAK